MEITFCLYIFFGKKHLHNKSIRQQFSTSIFYVFGHDRIFLSAQNKIEAKDSFII